MNPVSTATSAPSTSQSMVLEWPPGRESASIIVTRWVWESSQAAESPEMPDPMTAMWRGFTELAPVF
jgi:hypothetical protein